MDFILELFDLFIVLNWYYQLLAVILFFIIWYLFGPLNLFIVNKINFGAFINRESVNRVSMKRGTLYMIFICGPLSTVLLIILFIAGFIILTFLIGTDLVENISPSTIAEKMFKINVE